MASIGEMLRQAREAQGRSVTDLAVELCITERYLRALEENDLATLPGAFFYQSFVRQYAAILGVDSNRINKLLGATTQVSAMVEPQKLSREQTADSSAAQSALWTPWTAFLSRIKSSSTRSMDPIVEDTNRRYFAGYPVGLSAAGLVAAVLLGSGIFAWWSRPPKVAPAADSSASKVEGTSVVAVKGVAASPGGSTVSVDAAASADDPNQLVLNLSATEETWLSITSHGKVLFSGVLQPSQSKTLKGGEVATMKIGNAGGVDVRWNGKPIGPIGPRGQVRTVRFTRQDFHVLTAADEAPAEPVRDDL